MLFYQVWVELTKAIKEVKNDKLWFWTDIQEPN